MLRLWVATTILLSLVHCKTTKTEEKHHKLLLISFDGMRFDYPDRVADLEGFKYLKENGVKAKYMQGVFPTLTSPTHFSIATGLYTESHKVVHNCYYNHSSDEQPPSHPDFYETLLINEWWDAGGEPIWITAVKQGLKSVGYLFPGSYATINSVSATVRVLDSADAPQEESDWRLRIHETMKMFTDRDMDFVALYFPEPDLETHKLGPNDASITEISLPLVSRTIMYLVEQVKKYKLSDDLNIIITSDHGFEEIDTTVDESEIIQLSNYVNRSYVKFEFADGPIGLVEPIPGKASYVAEQLRKGNSHMRVYLKEDLPEELHYKNNDRVPSIVVIADPGFEVYSVFPAAHVYAGNHGYDVAVENMRTVFYSIGPSFKKGYEIDGFESVNIYPLMCHLLGLDPAPNNGSLEVLKETLLNEQSGNFSNTSLYVACIIIMLYIARYCYKKLKQWNLLQYSRRSKDKKLVKKQF